MIGRHFRHIAQKHTVTDLCWSSIAGASWQHLHPHNYTVHHHRDLILIRIELLAWWHFYRFTLRPFRHCCVLRHDRTQVYERGPSVTKDDCVVTYMQGGWSPPPSNDKPHTHTHTHTHTHRGALHLSCINIYKLRSRNVLYRNIGSQYVTSARGWRQQTGSSYTVMHKCASEAPLFLCWSSRFRPFATLWFIASGSVSEKAASSSSSSSKPFFTVAAANRKRFPGWFPACPTVRTDWDILRQ